MACSSTQRQLSEVSYKLLFIGFRVDWPMCDKGQGLLSRFRRQTDGWPGEQAVCFLRSVHSHSEHKHDPASSADDTGNQRRWSKMQPHSSLSLHHCLALPSLREKTKEKHLTWRVQKTLDLDSNRLYLILSFFFTRWWLWAHSDLSGQRHDDI